MNARRKRTGGHGGPGPGQEPTVTKRSDGRGTVAA
jgi:hypothetical protein